MTKIILVLLCILIGTNTMELAYPCEVEFCQQCSYYNFCGLCNPNYILSINTQTNIPFCQKIECEVDNCQNCLQTNVCNKCDDNFYITKFGTCKQGSRDIQCPMYCSYCSDQGKCELCNYGFILQPGGFCVTRVNTSEWCQVGFYQDMCQLCQQNYLVGVAYLCVKAPSFNCNNASYCLSCNAQNNCSQCQKGYYLMNGQCMPNQCNVTYCETCQDSTQCMHCLNNYYLQNNQCKRKIYSCMDFCKSCALYPQVCTQCMPGYQLQYLVPGMMGLAARCVKITQGDNGLVSLYCQKFGKLLLGSDTQLQNGCLQCEENYLNVGGYCVANLTQSQYNCTVANCKYCVQNNYCGQCMDGYYTQIYTGGQCFKNYSPLPYCDLTTIFIAQCQQCNSGFVNNMGQCVKFKDGTCNVMGCGFCLENDQCIQCRMGWEFSNSTNSSCTPICDVQFCFQCFDTTNCGYCEYGYVLANNGTCILAEDADVNCTSDYGQNCIQCNAKNCTSCADGFILQTKNNFCCQPPTQNYFGCIQYESVCSSTCVQCQIGYFLIANQCFAFPCNISNCNYCFRTDTCIVCDQGYTLNDQNVCTQFTAPAVCPPYCVACDADGTCNECLNGYKLNLGKCNCDFQNCLYCQADAFCLQCAYPTAATVFSNVGCNPAPVSASVCNISNCFRCTSPLYCAQCTQGYTLKSDGGCIPNTCNQNCLLCDINREICFLCAEGYIQDAFLGQNCVQLAIDYSCTVQGCGICATSDTCDTCLQFYQLTQDKKCAEYDCVENCLLCLQNNTCFICDFNYYLTTDNVCAPTTVSSRLCDSIQNCIACQDYTDNVTNVTQLVCDICFPGFTVTQQRTQCQPQDCNIPYCGVCLPTSDIGLKFTLCLVCQQGFYLNSYLQCVKYSPPVNTVTCDVYNCLHCDRNNTCAFCLFGWNATGSLCETNLYCDINDCSSCTKPTLCVTCNQNFKLSQSGNVCTPLCNITNCQQCSSLTACGQCKDTFILSNDGSQCNCPDDTFEVANSKCQCPEGKLQFNGTCVDCSIQFCDFCQQANVCSQCLDTFLLQNNTCSCAATFIVNNSKCVCPTDFKEHDGACIQCRIDFCAECDQINNCILCNANFQLQLNDTCQCPTDFTIFKETCNLCNDSLYCQVCSAQNFCETCDDTFEVKNGTCACPSLTTLFNSTCVACNISNCDLCQQANICTTCKNKFTLLSNVCLSCNIDSCIFCSSQNNCAQCQTGLQISSQGNLCVTCNNNNCQKCSSNNICAVCTQGFQFNANNTECFNCSNVPGCKYCSADNVCQQCLQGFDLSGGQCAVCSYPCQTCNSNGTCATCQPPFSLNSNTNNNQCFTCSTPNCKICSQTNTSLCSTCQDSYQLDLVSLTCSLICSTNLCLSCTDVEVCEVCIDGYVPVGSGCLKCANAPKCRSCQSQDTSICTSCNDGYFLQAGNCISCASNNCKRCVNGANLCTEFKQSTKQIAFVTSSGVVVPAVCNPGCQSCSTTNPNNCIVCQQGYSLQNQYCIPCKFPCKTCVSGDQTSCLSCYSNAFLNNNACSTCTNTSNCLTCSSTNLTACTSCPYGYSLAANNTCVLGCPSNCLSCSNSSFCTVCSDGYSANGQGQCLPCLSNCRGCSGSQQAVCVSCGQGFFLNTQNTCQVCTQFCSNCIDSQTCTQCLAGYTLTNSFVCAKNCRVPCATCSTSDPTKCSSCVAGYTLDQTNSVCNAVTTCPNNICQVCPFSFVLNGNSCFQCDTSCARCQTSNSSLCTSCLDGMYLRNSSCVACPQGCETCTSLANCLTCSSGYTIESSPISTVVNCIQCQSPCAQCIGDAQTCTSCVSGFQLQGWKCMSSFNFGLTLVLSANLIDFYPSYLSFLQAIVNAVSQSNINLVTMILLVQGSTNTTLNVTTTQPTGSLAATNEYNGLVGLVNDGSIGNLTVTSGTVDVVGGQVQDNSSGPNLALILGITIPLAVILIGGIVYFLCSRRNNTDYSEKQNNDNDMTVRQQFQLTNDVTART